MRVRINFLPREKSAYIYLRNTWGYSISVLSKVFGRSASVIQRILKRASYGVRRFDLRKIPPRIRRALASRQHQKLSSLRVQYENWILGEGEKPP